MLTRRAFLATLAKEPAAEPVMIPNGFTFKWFGINRELFHMSERRPRLPQIKITANDPRDSVKAAQMSLLINRQLRTQSAAILYAMVAGEGHAPAAHALTLSSKS